jgi:MFS transporter, FLVCR family, feline leukemia virus subgroup C receptor-related protein
MTSILYSVTLPIANALEDAYKIDHSVMVLIPIVYLLMHPLLTFVVSVIIRKYGVAKNNFLGGILLILGAGIRVLVNKWFYVLIIGSVFAGAGRPIILNA